jgi:hypothetical protein
MIYYRIGYGWGGVKIQRETDEEAIAYARKHAAKTKGGKKILTVYRADGTRILKEQR